jgi:hypothetical protein
MGLKVKSVQIKIVPDYRRIHQDIAFLLNQA